MSNETKQSPEHGLGFIFWTAIEGPYALKCLCGTAFVNATFEQTKAEFNAHCRENRHVPQTTADFSPIVMQDFRRDLIRMVENVTQNPDGSHTFHINADSSGETFLYRCLMCGAQFYDAEEIVAARMYHDHSCAVAERLQAENVRLQDTADDERTLRRNAQDARDAYAKENAELKQKLDRAKVSLQRLENTLHKTADRLGVEVGETLSEGLGRVLTERDELKRQLAREKSTVAGLMSNVAQLNERLKVTTDALEKTNDALEKTNKVLEQKSADADLGALVRQMPVSGLLQRLVDGYWCSMEAEGFVRNVHTDPAGCIQMLTSETSNKRMPDV